MTITAHDSFISNIGPEPKLLRRTKDFYEVEASFDLSKIRELPGKLNKSLGWKFASIESTKENIADNKFVTIIEFNGALVGFKFGDI